MQDRRFFDLPCTAKVKYFRNLHNLCTELFLSEACPGAQQALAWLLRLFLYFKVAEYRHRCHSVGGQCVGIPGLSDVRY